jgi:hypothetical protein
MSPGHLLCGDLVAVLCIGVAPTGSPGRSRLCFMRCFADGTLDFYDDPDSACGDPPAVQTRPPLC